MALERDADRLCQWARANDMRFKKSHWWMLHLGDNNAMEGSRLGEECKSVCKGGQGTW